MRRGGWLFGTASIAALCASLANAQEVTTFTYDALGRLTNSSISGGPNNSWKAASCYDPTGNRVNYATTSSTPDACPTPTPTPSGPIANNDAADVDCYDWKLVNLVANDTDPGGNYPLSLVSITYSSGDPNATAFVATATKVNITGSNVPGTTYFTYVIQNSISQTAAATLMVNTTANGCD